MRGDVLVTDAIAQVFRGTFRQPPRVDKDQRGLVFVDELGQAVVDLLPHFVGHDGFQRRAGHLQGQVALAYMAGVDDVATFVPNPQQETGHRLDGFLRGGAAHAGESMRRQRG